jgi:hypothetical protein
LKKQEAWLDNIRAIQDERGSSLDSDVRQLLDTIIGFDNIPRKRQKFINFIQVDHSKEILGDLSCTKKYKGGKCGEGVLHLEIKLLKVLSF